MPSVDLSRRSLLRGAAVAGALIVAAEAIPSSAGSNGVFRHGVASGDPLGDAVIIWTRVTPEPKATPGSGLGLPVDVTWEVARDPKFAKIVRKGVQRTSVQRDHTVKVDVKGLSPYTRYWYRFSALGATSPVGRTQTASDDGRIHSLRLAYVSCSNWTGGYFTSYRHMAKRDDLDAVVFLGDYIYDYGNGTDGGYRYGPKELIGKRDHQPANETISLRDYRQRHAQYKTDPDLQLAHAAYPWIVTFDDHEVADNSYKNGAANHQEQEGDFFTRRRAAYTAYMEYMPIRMPDQKVKHTGTRFWRRFSFGPLADLTMIETRQNRDKEVDGAAAALKGINTTTEILESIIVVNSTELASPDRHLMEPAQMDWLVEGIKAKNAKWHLIGNQTVFSRIAIGASAPGATALAEAGIGAPIFNSDQWDGYQHDQAQVLEAMKASGGDVVVLTGDIHTSIAIEVPYDPGTYPVANNSVAVEIVCPSITANGLEESVGGGVPGKAVITGLTATNTHVKYAEGKSHGYSVVDVTPTRIQSDWYFVADRLDPKSPVSFAKSFTSAIGTHRLVESTSPIGKRADNPH